MGAGGSGLGLSTLGTSTGHACPAQGAPASQEGQGHQQTGGCLLRGAAGSVQTSRHRAHMGPGGCSLCWGSGRGVWSSRGTWASHLVVHLLGAVEDVDHGAQGSAQVLGRLRLARPGGAGGGSAHDQVQGLGQGYVAPAKDPGHPVGINPTGARSLFVVHKLHPWRPKDWGCPRAADTVLGWTPWVA